MKIISNIFKIIIFISLIISSGCGLLSTSLIIKEQIQSNNFDNDEFIYDYAYLLEEEEKCMKPETLDISACIQGVREFHLFVWRMIITFAIGGNICLLILIYRYFKRRKRKKLSSI